MKSSSVRFRRLTMVWLPFCDRSCGDVWDEEPATNNSLGSGSKQLRSSPDSRTVLLELLRDFGRRSSLLGGCAAVANGSRDRVAGLRTEPRRAVTLMELLLVLAVLVAVAAMAWPAMVGPLETQRLRAGAERVRVQWVRARVKAIETGRTYVFRFASNGQACVIEPWLTADDYLESNELIGLTPQAAGTAAPASGQTMTIRPTTTTATSSIEEVELPENIVFGPFEVEADASQLLAGAMGGPMASLMAPSNADSIQPGAPVSGLEPTQDWASIYFYPDGTSTSARLMVLDSRGRHMVLSLRGLTGVVTVSDVKSQQRL